MNNELKWPNNMECLIQDGNIAQLCSKQQVFQYNNNNTLVNLNKSQHSFEWEITILFPSLQCKHKTTRIWQGNKMVIFYSKLLPQSHCASISVIIHLLTAASNMSTGKGACTIWQRNSSSKRLLQACISKLLLTETHSCVNCLHVIQCICQDTELALAVNS